VKRVAPKWIWIGAAGGMVLLLSVLFAAVSNPTPGPASTAPASTGPESTEPASSTPLSTESHLEADAAAATLQPAIPAEGADSPTPQPAATEFAADNQPDSDPLAYVRSNWNVVIDDSFDTNDNDWDTGDFNEADNAAGTLQIVDGKYHWRYGRTELMRR